MSSKTLSKNVKIFCGSIDSLLNYCSTEEKLLELTENVKKEIKNTTVLYTKHIEEKYFDNRTTGKRFKNDYLEYLLLFINHCQYKNLLPLTKMWLFAALDIPRAIKVISKSNFEQFVNEIYDRVDKAKITHGDAVGIIAAQSCSERFTQSALNSFHSAGAKKSALVGISRIKEILDAFKKLNLPVLGPIDPKYDIEKLYGKTLADYCSESKVINNPELAKENRSNYLLYFKLKDPDDWHVIKNSTYIPQKSKDEMFFMDGVIYMSLHKNTTISHPKLIMEYNKGSRDPQFEPMPNHAYTVFNTEANRHVSGLENCIDYDEEDQLLFFKPKTNLAQCTKSPFPDDPDSFKSNIDFSELLSICPDLDTTKIVSNDIYWIYTTLGISAVEVYLTKEIQSVLGAEGININVQHINLIAANMTHTGEILANKYSGLKGTKSVIRKATFQQGTETFSKAAAKSSIDTISDVSSQILMGKLASIGTAYSHIVDSVVENPVKRYNSPEYVPPSPEYAPASPEIDNNYFQVASPEYAPASPMNDIMIEPEIHI